MQRALLLLLLTSHFLQAQSDFAPSEIEIMRDQWGVPHIYAPTDAQVAYGLAWAHAEDDFKTIQTIMLAAKQMLGQHLGKTGAPVDYVVGLLRAQEIVENHLDDFSPEFVKIVEGYAAGLNSYASHHPDEVFLKKAFPVTLHEVFKAYVLQLAVFDGADRVIRDLFNSDVDLALKGTGSNAIAIRQHKTADEYTYLAVNAHQPLEGPDGWYEAHLVSDEGWNTLGGLFPGSPTVLLGTNENLGWAHTVNYPDKLDVFHLEMHPENKNSYRFDDEWLELDHRKIKLKVKVFLGMKITVKKDAYYSIYGPVVKNDKGVFAFKMAVFDEMRAVEQWYRMNKATNLAEFKSVMEMTAIPGFNTVYADREDNIFYVSNGKIPFRNPAYDWKTTLPGNTSATLTPDYHPFSDLPQLTNPKAGYLFNTNNTPYSATAREENLQFKDYDSTMGYRTTENNRSTRFMGLIDQFDKVSWQDFIDMKYDVSLPDSLLYRININAVFRMNPDLAGKGSEIVKIIQKWDRMAEIESIGPAQSTVFYSHLAKRKEDITIEAVTPDQMIESLIYTNDYFMEHFSKLDVSLGEYQKLVRGDKELPLRGMADVLAAMYSVPHENGKVKGYAGDSYVMMIRYPKEGLPIIETIHAYGASSKPDSPHYNDQMEMFTQQKRKTMTLDIEEVRKNSIRVYSPK
ncbi:MAG: acylase [Cytophagales bacterium]|nr:acylase [Cytophagales bacterium]